MKHSKQLDSLISDLQKMVPEAKVKEKASVIRELMMANALLKAIAYESVRLNLSMAKNNLISFEERSALNTLTESLQNLSTESLMESTETLHQLLKLSKNKY